LTIIIIFWEEYKLWISSLHNFLWPPVTFPLLGTDMRAIQKVTTGELFAKRTMKKINLLYTKNMYILKLFLNIVTAGTEALVSENNVLYANVKEVCHM
jgi:hypothetical protein